MQIYCCFGISKQHEQIYGIFCKKVSKSTLEEKNHNNDHSEAIFIKGREHNLKNIDVSIPGTNWWW